MRISYRRLPAVAFLVVLGAATSARQAPVTPAAPPAGLVVGQTLDSLTGKPLGGVVVSLGLTPSPGIPAAAVSQRLLSDRDGHFVFHGLPAGSYLLTASKAGYVDGAFGRRVAGGGSQPVVLQADERRGGCDLRLWRYATISGAVTDEAGEPLLDVPIRLVKRGVLAGAPRFLFVPNSTSTDDRGRYRIASLAPGEYLISVISTQATLPTSVVEAATAAMRTSGSQDFDREISRSSPMASIGGSPAMTIGQRVGDWLLTAPLPGFGSNSQPMMPVDAGAVFVYPPTFYPSTTSPARAQVVAVAAGEDKTGIDLQLSPVPSVRVSGTLTGPDGPESMTSISLIPASAEEWQRDYDLATATTITDGRGAFTFLGVPAGTYGLRVLKIPPRPVTPASQSGTIIQNGNNTISTGGGVPADPPAIPDTPTLWAQQPLAVGERDVTDLAVTLRTGARVIGRLEFSGATAPPTPDRLRQAIVQLDPADGRETSLNATVTLTRGVVGADAQFKTYQQPPGRYTIRGPSFPGWTFIGASLDARDLGDAGVEIGGEDVTGVVLHFTDQPSDVSGAVLYNRAPDATATILVFPSAPSGWLNAGRLPLRLRSTRAGTSGAYRFAGLPPGEYLVIALKDERADWQDAKVLARLAPLATRVTIANGDHKVQDLQTQEIK